MSDRSRLALVVALIGLGLSTQACERPVSPSAPPPHDVRASFVDGTWELRVNRAWNNPPGEVLPTNPLTEGDYQPVPAGAVSYRMAVTSSGQELALGEAPIRGVRVWASSNVVEYSVGILPGGARLVVWLGGGGLQGELTVLGSRPPILKSERGVVVLVK